MKRGSGPFVPYPRLCDTCSRMGWSSWPSSVVNGWRCCGKPEGSLAKEIEARARSAGEANTDLGAAASRGRGSRRGAKGGKGAGVKGAGGKGAGGKGAGARGAGSKSTKASKKGVLAGSERGAIGELGTPAGKGRAARPKGVVRGGGLVSGGKSAGGKLKGAKSAAAAGGGSAVKDHANQPRRSEVAGIRALVD